MHIAVVGTGAVGGYFGGRLAQAGEDVVFLARGAHLRAIEGHGLQVESVDGDFAIRRAHVTDNPAEIGPVDLVLLALKGWQVLQAIETLRPWDARTGGMHAENSRRLLAYVSSQIHTWVQKLLISSALELISFAGFLSIKRFGWIQPFCAQKFKRMLHDDRGILETGRE